MARVTVRAGWRSRATGLGISGVSAVLARKSDTVSLDTDSTDAHGVSEHDVDYPGPHTVTLTSGGETRTIDSDVVGFAGDFALMDLPVAFQAFASGVLPDYLNELALTPGSGRAVNVGTGAGLVLGRTYVNDAALDVAIDANSSGNPRIDLIVLRLERTYSAGVREVGRRVLTKVTGTPAASPVAPAPVQSADVWDVVLGQVTVASGAGSFVAGNIATTGKTWMVPQRVEADRIQGGTIAGDLTLAGTTRTEQLIVNETNVAAILVEKDDGTDALVMDTSASRPLLTLNGDFKLGGTSPPPSVAFGAGAGSGPVLVSLSGSDSAMFISASSGTGAAAGTFLTVTFGTARPDANYAVVPCFHNINTPARDWYTSSHGTTDFLLRWNAPLSSTQVSLTLLVLQYAV